MRNKGFTLIEILIAVAIMAILTAIFVPNFLGIRARARDTRRKADLNELQKAIELFRLDQNPPVYPDTGILDPSLCNQCWSQGADCTGNIYMKKVPCDPGTLDAVPYIYYLDAGDNLKYTLSACLENTEDPDKDSVSITECSDIGRESYTLTEP